MHIISGTYKGRNLLAPAGQATRPAMAKTREALFSMLEARGVCWSASKVLDLFAGTGSLAFEAISRGAESATLVESGKIACECIAKNVNLLGIEAKCHLACQDVLRFLQKAPLMEYNLVFIDPPYRANMAARTLAGLAKSSLLAADAFIAAEIETGTSLAEPEKFSLCQERQYGQTSIYIWKIK